MIKRSEINILRWLQKKPFHVSFSSNHGHLFSLRFLLEPSYPRSVSLLALNESAMQVQWEEPRYMNGKIDHYIVKYQSRNYDEELFLRTDVCVDQSIIQ